VVAEPLRHLYALHEAAEDGKPRKAGTGQAAWRPTQAVGPQMNVAEPV
jgi:hypothetical protein